MWPRRVLSPRWPCALLLKLSVAAAWWAAQAERARRHSSLLTQAVLTHERVLCRGTAGASLCIRTNTRLPLVQVRPTNRAAVACRDHSTQDRCAATCQPLSSVYGCCQAISCGVLCCHPLEPANSNSLCLRLIVRQCWARVPAHHGLGPLGLAHAAQGASPAAAACKPCSKLSMHPHSRIFCPTGY